MFFGRITQTIVHFFKLLFSDDYILKFFSEYLLYSTVIITKGFMKNEQRLLFSKGIDEHSVNRDGGEVYVVVPQDDKYSDRSCLYKTYSPMAYFWDVELSLYSYETNSNHSLCIGSICETRRMLMWLYIFGRTYKSKYKNIELLSLGG